MSRTLAYAIVILVVAAGVYLYSKTAPTETTDQNGSQATTTPDQTTPAPATTTQSTAPAPEPRTSYVDKAFGFSFSYPTAWKVETKNVARYGDAIVLTKPDGDSIIIGKVSGTEVQDDDAKFGSVTYYFNSGAGTWMWMGDDDRGDAVLPAVATPIFSTDSGLQVLAGRGRWKTDIVPLSHTKFLIVNMTGSGYTKDLDPLVKTIAALVPTVSTPSQPITNPYISAAFSSTGVQNSFYSGDQATLNGFNFPYKTKPTLWFGPIKIAPAFIASVTANKISFKVPTLAQLAPGTYNVFFTSAADADPNAVVQSNILKVAVVPSVVVSSISPASLRSGDSAVVSGKGFTSTSDSIVQVDIQKMDQGRVSSFGILWSGQPQSDTSIVFPVPLSYCTFGGAPGVPCTQYAPLSSGTYHLNVSFPSGGNSNTIDFTVR